MALGGQNVVMVRRRQDAAECWAPRDRDEALSGLGDALGALDTFVGAGEVLLRRVSPRRFRVAQKHVEPAGLTARGSRGTIPALPSMATHRSKEVR